MGLFNLGKKNQEVKKPACACNASVESTKEELQSIKVLGAGCKSCHEMYENTKAALQIAGIDIEVEYITDMEKVMEYGVMSMPGLVVNEKVVSMGKVLKSVDVEKLLYKLGFL